MMENITLSTGSAVTFDKRVMPEFNIAASSFERTVYNPVLDLLRAEGEEDFFHYVEWLGLANDPDLLILPSTQHYYYDFNDLKGIKTLINLKRMNLIRHLDGFLHSVYHILSPKTNFIGCFYDYKSQKRNDLTSRMYKGFLNFLDSRTDIQLDSKEVMRRLQTHGFRVIDMTEFNGLTYFRAVSIRMSAE
jgi:hypothetical protein